MSLGINMNKGTTMTDKVRPAVNSKQKLSMLEREKRISHIFNFSASLNDDESWDVSIELPVDELDEKDFSSASEEAIGWWEELAGQTVVYGEPYTGDDDFAGVFSQIKAKESLALMVKHQILKADFQKEDLEAFFAERAAIADWCGGIESLALIEYVRPDATEWWKRYIARPKKVLLNPITEFGLLIRAGLLPKYFKKSDLLCLVLELNFVSTALSIHLMEVQGYLKYWELTDKGFEEAERADQPSASSSTKRTQESISIYAKYDRKNYLSIPEIAKENEIKTRYDSFKKRIQRWGEKNIDYVRNEQQSGLRADAPTNFYFKLHPEIRNIIDEFKRLQ